RKDPETPFAISFARFGISPRTIKGRMTSSSAPFTPKIMTFGFLGEGAGETGFGWANTEPVKTRSPKMPTALRIRMATLCALIPLAGFWHQALLLEQSVSGIC